MQVSSKFKYKLEKKIKFYQKDAQPINISSTNAQPVKAGFALLAENVSNIRAHS